MQPSHLRLFTTNLLQLILNSFLSISSRLIPLLLFISGISLILISSLHPSTHRSTIHNSYPFSHQPISQSTLHTPIFPWAFASDPLLRFTSTTTDSLRFKPSRFSEPTPAQTSISSRKSEKFISSGLRHPSLSNSKPQPIDLVWTWVNESETYHDSQNGDALDSKPTSYLYRQHDELKFSLRSSLKSLPSKYINSRIILSADRQEVKKSRKTHSKNWISQQNPQPRLHQVWSSRPSWLTPHNLYAPDRATAKPPVLILKHHSHIFKFKHYSPLASNLSHWIQNYIPSHNSLAIESQFGHLTGIKNHFLYLNDDCFFINNFGEGDFTSELFGPVFRIQFDLNVEEDAIDRSGTEEAMGEWPSLSYSNYLLSRRFGRRSRRYINHVAKVSNIQMMREVSEIWEDEIFWTASSRYRGQRREINMMFLTTWYQIEKHREAMLHSFLMLKSDSNQDGVLGDHEWEAMMKDVIGKGSSGDLDRTIIKVFKPFRPRLESIEKILGDYRPLQTDYEWLSSDGYPLINATVQSIPNYQAPEKDLERTVICELNVTQCFPKSYRRSEDLMRWIAIEKPECGDCLIGLLIGRRPMGMEPFLPPTSLRTKIAVLLDQPVYWNSFSNSDKNSSSVKFYSDRRPSSSRFYPGGFLTDDPRIWAVRNLQRYQYVLGNTPSDFRSLTTMLSSKKIFNDLSTKFKNDNDKNKKPPRGKAGRFNKNNVINGKMKNEGKLNVHDGLLVTLNDRIVEIQLSMVGSMFKNWLQSSWPLSAPWEKN